MQEPLTTRERISGIVMFIVFLTVMGTIIYLGMTSGITMDDSDMIEMFP